jgi:SPOR domain
MRTLFFLLVLANAAFFAWSTYYAPMQAASDPLPLKRQIDPERLKIISPKDLPSAPVTSAPPVQKAAAMCVEWGSFTANEAPRAEKALEVLGPGAQIAQRRSDEPGSWWVITPPQGSRQAAYKKAAELKALGVEEYYIVAEEGDYQWALSLGVFRSEEAAKARLGALQAVGVRSARVTPRETPAYKIWLQVKGVDAPLEARLKDIARQIEGTELRKCL